MCTGVVIYIYNLMHDVKTAMLHILKSRLKYEWCSENFNIRYGQMVLDWLQSIFCTSPVTKSFIAKRFTLPHPKDESKSRDKLRLLYPTTLVECRSN